MNSHDRDVREKVKEWVSFAEDDLRLGLCAVKLKSNVPYRLIAYHAQQCAEKYLKAYLVYRNVDFPYTHSIGALLKLCSKYASWVKELADADHLSPYAITARYPGQDEPVAKSDAQKAIELAKEVRWQVRADLKDLGLDIED